MLEAGLPIPSVQNRGEWQVAGVRCEQASIQHNDTAQRSHSGALGVLVSEILEENVGVGQFVGHWPHLAADGAVRETPELLLTTRVGMRDAQLSALALPGNAALFGPCMTAHRLTPLCPPVHAPDMQSDRVSAVMLLKPFSKSLSWRRRTGSAPAFTTVTPRW